MALSGVALLGLLRPLLLPRQPELPQLPPVLALDEDWQLASDPPAHHRRGSHPVWRPVAVGPTSRLLGPSGQQVLITPLASWSLEAFDPEAAVRGMAGLDLSKARSGTGPGLQQHCLTEDGKTAEGAEELQELLKRKDPKFFSTPYRSIRRMVLPPQPRSKSCLLLTTESADLLSTSTASFSTASPRVFEQLSLQVLWPPTGDKLRPWEHDSLPN
jgi:hypothetical protein